MRLRPFSAAKAHQSGADIEQETDKGGDRIARKAEIECVANLSETHRSTGLDCKLPQMAFAERIQRGDHVIFLTTRSTAGCDDRLAGRCRLSQGSPGRIGAVSDNAKIMDGDAQRGEERLKQEAVGIVNLA